MNFPGILLVRNLENTQTESIRFLLFGEGGEGVGGGGRTLYKMIVFRNIKYMINLDKDLMKE